MEETIQILTTVTNDSLQAEFLEEETLPITSTAGETLSVEASVERI